MKQVCVPGHYFRPTEATSETELPELAQDRRYTQGITGWTFLWIEFEHFNLHEICAKTKPGIGGAQEDVVRVEQLMLSPAHLMSSSVFLQLKPMPSIKIVMISNIMLKAIC